MLTRPPTSLLAFLSFYRDELPPEVIDIALITAGAGEAKDIASLLLALCLLKDKALIEEADEGSYQHCLLQWITRRASFFRESIVKRDTPTIQALARHAYPRRELDTAGTPDIRHIEMLQPLILVSEGCTLHTVTDSPEALIVWKNFCKWLDARYGTQSPSNPAPTVRYNFDLDDPPPQSEIAQLRDELEDLRTRLDALAPTDA